MMQINSYLDTNIRPTIETMDDELSKFKIFADNIKLLM